MIPVARAQCKRNPATVAGHGISLPEVLVVIGVVAILLAVSLPSLQGARSRARGIGGLSNIRQLGTLVSLYMDVRGSAPALLAPIYSSDPSDEQEFETVWGTIHGYWWTNAYLFHFALDEMPDASVLTDPGHPAADTAEHLERTGVAMPDYALSESFYAEPAYWDRWTQRGPVQWRTQALERVRYPSNKVFMKQTMAYDVPGFPSGYMACCVDAVQSSVLWSDLSSTREVQGNLLPGAPNFWDVRLPPPQVWASGRPVDCTQDGVLGRDRE